MDLNMVRAGVVKHPEGHLVVTMKSRDPVSYALVDYEGLGGLPPGWLILLMLIEVGLKMS
jgi:hypothetical protein